MSSAGSTPRADVYGPGEIFWGTVTVVQAYTRFMVVFFIMVGVGCAIKPLTDAPGGGLILWPEAGRTFGIFLINWVHTVLHLGLAGYAALAFARTSAARSFGQTVFWICAVLAPARSVWSAATAAAVLLWSLSQSSDTSSSVA